jgi:hypothetical protein
VKALVLVSPLCFESGIPINKAHPIHLIFRLLCPYPYCRKEGHTSRHCESRQ